jgi:hypothetical protein
VHAAGEVVPAFEVLDAVASDVADIGHTPPSRREMPAATFSQRCRGLRPASTSPGSTPAARRLGTNPALPSA